VCVPSCGNESSFVRDKKEYRLKKLHNMELSKLFRSARESEYELIFNNAIGIYVLLAGKVFKHLLINYSIIIRI
jgi:hypothetical protein